MRRTALISGAVVAVATAVVTLPPLRRQAAKLLVYTTGTVVRTQRAGRPAGVEGNARNRGE